MKTLGRLILFLYGLLISMLSLMIIVGVVLVFTEQIYYESITENIYELLTYKGVMPAVIVVFTIAFVVSLKLTFKGIGEKNERQPVIRTVAGGEVAIALDTFESIAVSTLKKVPEAKEYSVIVKKANEGVSASIKLSVLPEVNIPELAESIQTKIIAAIENITGVKVLNVRVKVENICAGFKNKVE